MLLVHLGSPGEGERFLDERWPEARAASDPDETLFAAFGLGRGSLSQVIGPGPVLAGIRATLRGHKAGKPVGSVRTMSGWFLVHGERVLWAQRHRHIGEPRRWEELAAALASR